MKSCSQCKKTKSLDEFHKGKSRPQGVYPTCKECRAKRRKMKRWGGVSKGEAMTRAELEKLADELQAAMEKVGFVSARGALIAGFKLGRDAAEKTLNKKSLFYDEGGTLIDRAKAKQTIQALGEGE